MYTIHGLEVTTAGIVDKRRIKKKKVLLISKRNTDKISFHKNTNGCQMHFQLANPNFSLILQIAMFIFSCSKKLNVTWWG